MRRRRRTAVHPHLEFALPDGFTGRAFGGDTAIVDGPHKSLLLVHLLRVKRVLPPAQREAALSDAKDALRARLDLVGVRPLSTSSDVKS